MSQTSKDQRGAAYTIPLKRIERSNRSNHSSKHDSSLPSILPQKDEKVNIIRRQLQQTKNEVSIMKARINALHKEKSKNEQRKSKNLKQIEFLRTVRERMFRDKQMKESYRNKRKSEVQLLHNQVHLMRQQMIKQRAISRSILKEQKSDCASEQRNRRRQDQEYITQVRHLEQEQNRIRAEQIKRAQLQHEAKMKYLQESRLVRAQKNHQGRVVSSLREKKKMDRTLSSLKQKQDSLILSVKEAEQQMMESLYELETLNPERRSRCFKSSRTLQTKH